MNCRLCAAALLQLFISKQMQLWNVLDYTYLSLLFFFPLGDVEEIEIQEKPALKVFKNITVIQEPGMVVLEVR